VSFSISADGTRDVVLAALESVTHSDPLGEGVRDAIATCLRSAAAESATGAVLYSVAADGSSGPGQMPQLRVTVTSAAPSPS
jgi:hypothetical protein